MSDIGEAGIDAFLTESGIVAPTIGESQQFNFSNTNIVALFQSDAAEASEPASLGLPSLGLTGLGLVLRKRAA